MNFPGNSSDRRKSPRLKAHLEAELSATLSLLDGDLLDDPSSSLTFMGETLDVSEEGLSLVLPSIRIDESCCDRPSPLELALHLPNSPVRFEIEPVRCRPLRAEDPDQGYLVGVRINSVEDEDVDEWRQYISSLTD